MRKKFAKGLEKIGIKENAIKLVLGTGNLYRTSKKKIRGKIIPRLINKRSKNGYYAIDIDTDWNGFGSRVIKTLEILMHCEKHKLIPAIKYNYLEKTDRGKDYFKEIFYYKNLSEGEERKLRFTKIWDNDETGWTENYNEQLKLSFAKDLFFKYLGIQEDILREVALFKKENFKGQKTMGLHYRGTDKAGEAPLVQRENLLNTIKAELDKRRDLKLIFLSTDDEAIIHFLKNSDLQIPIIYREDTLRSSDGEQFHRKKGNPKSMINRDAIVNCLLLSECDFLLKTASFLSECSVMFNPSIEVKVMNRPHSEELTWWPLKEILENEGKR